MSKSKDNYQKPVMGLLALSALGIVFGDIGTSPLYAFSIIFGKSGHDIAINKTDVFGIISLVIWSITIVVSIKYVSYVMRADNSGEGGIMALIAQIRRLHFRGKRSSYLLILGIIGVALFYGDSTITPAVSVLSAVEGLKVVTPHLSDLIVPITLAVLIILFSLQRFGSGLVGELFGPVMLLWFLTIGVAGGWQIWHSPDVLTSLLPTTAIGFFILHPVTGFIAMGAVILAITGAEALYADMGHFGRPAISRAWFFIVFPALSLCYMGEGALLLKNPSAAVNPLLLMMPHAIRFGFIILATLATVIASQSVIAGAFSLTRQAIHLNFLPKMMVQHTSASRGGQIYLPFINILLFIAVALLVIIFGSSAKLANAYGLAVSGTLAIDSIFFLIILRRSWQKSKRYTILLSCLFLPLDLIFISSSLSKFVHGGWFPVAIGAVIFTIMTTWISGEKILKKERQNIEGSLEEFAENLHRRQPEIMRSPGTAVYLGHHAKYAPLALQTTIAEMHELPEEVIILTVHVSGDAHIPLSERASYDTLKYNDGLTHVTLSFGFHDHIDVPEALETIRNQNDELKFNLNKIVYFVSLARVSKTKRHNLAGWRKNLYAILARNSLNSADYYKLPRKRTSEIATTLEL